MTNEDYLKKLKFTMSSVANGGGDVSGVVEFYGGSCLVFDQDNAEMHVSCGACLFIVRDIETLLIHDVCAKEVKRVFPDCC